MTRICFVDGPLAGQELRMHGARELLLDAGRYVRLRAVYADGDVRATDGNGGRLSHLEYTFKQEGWAS